MPEMWVEVHPAASPDRRASVAGKNGVRNGFHGPASVKGSFLAELQAETLRVGLEAGASERDLWQEIVDLLAQLSKRVGRFA